MHRHLDVRIEGEDAVLGALCLGSANLVDAKQDLTLEVVVLDHVKVNDADVAHARSGEVHQHGAAQSAGPDDQHMGLLELALSLEVEFGDDEVPAVAFKLGFGERMDHGVQEMPPAMAGMMLTSLPGANAVAVPSSSWMSSSPT